jgi:hypothetical protein
MKASKGKSNTIHLPPRSGRWLATAALCQGDLEEIIALFEQIAAAEGWQPDGELRAHVARSTYFGLWRDDINEAGILGEDREIGGGLQLVRPDHNGALPTQRVWPEIALADPDSAAHIAVLALCEDYRGKGGLFWLLTAAMWRHCVQEGIRELWLECTPRTLRAYRRFGWPLQVRGELRQHWGEPCHPCSLSVREVAGALAERAVRSEAYRNILTNMVGTHTIGISGVSGVAATTTIPAK